MAWRLSGDKPLSEPMMVSFTDVYMRHSASMSYAGQAWLQARPTEIIAIQGKIYLCGFASKRIPFSISFSKEGH